MQVHPGFAAAPGMIRRMGPMHEMCGSPLRVHALLKKKKGDCIAVQPLDHRTTQHDYEQKGEKNKTPSRAKLCQ